MEQIRLGVAGGGVVGSHHLTYMGELEEVELAAFCDTREEVAAEVGEAYGCPTFTDYSSMLKDDGLDAVLIATPHTLHPEMAIEAFEAGLHVLSEKPIAVHVKAAARMIAVADAHPDQAFGVMFQERTRPVFREAKRLIEAGEIAPIVRVNWIATEIFRSQAYYDSGGWRATWKGEGGGVLLNQCPHYLDLLQWLTGCPIQVTAQCGFGRFHEIAVEDDVSALLEYDDGAKGVFVATTGELPGTDCLEIIGDRGRIVIEHQQDLTFQRASGPVSAFCHDTAEHLASMIFDEVPIELEETEFGHKVVTRAFARHVLHGEPMVADGREGMHSLSLGNAMVLSALEGRPVDLPMDGDAYEERLNALIVEEADNQLVGASS